MRSVNLCLLCFIVCTIGDQTSGEEGQLVSILPGIKVGVAVDGISIKFDSDSFYGGKSEIIGTGVWINCVMLVGRGKTGGGEEGTEADKRPKIMQKIGAMVMMVPLLMQLLSLPGAIASIKLSLLKSLIVGKMALIILLINFLRSHQSQEMVVVHHPPPMHYDHYYSPYEDDDEEKGWFG